MSDKASNRHPAIRRLLEKLGTQTAIAAAAGVRPHTICGKQASPNPLTYEQMERIMTADPRVTPGDFFPHLDTPRQASSEAA